jgi:hypothetical protein
MLFTEWVQNKELLIEAEIFAATIRFIECVDFLVESLGAEHQKAAEIIRAKHLGQHIDDAAYQRATNLLFGDIQERGRRLVRSHPVVRRNPSLEDDAVSYLSTAIYDYLTKSNRDIPADVGMEPWLRQHVRWAALRAQQDSNLFVPPPDYVDRDPTTQEKMPTTIPRRGQMPKAPRKGYSDNNDLEVKPDRIFGGAPREGQPESSIMRSELHEKLFNCIGALAKQGEDGQQSARILLKLYGFEPKPGSDPNDVSNYVPGISSRNPDYLRLGAKRHSGVSDSVDEPATGTLAPKNRSLARRELGIARTEFDNREREGKNFLRHCLTQHGVQGTDVGGVTAKEDDSE